MQRVYRKQLKPITRLIKKYPNTYKFCNNDINKFILLLRTEVYQYEYIHSWEKFNETIIPNKKAFHNKLHLEVITDEDYIHARNVFEELKLKNLGVIIMIYLFKAIHYCLQMHLKILGINVLKYISLILLVFYQDLI